MEAVSLYAIDEEVPDLVPSVLPLVPVPVSGAGPPSVPVQLWEHFDEQKQCELLGWILGIDRFDRAPWNNYKIDVEAMLKLAPGMDIEFIKKMAEEEKIQRLSITNKYSENLKVIGNRLCELVTIRQNLHPMSGWFSPHQLYVTPQCGEYTEHQIIIDKFSQINKSYIQEEEE